MKRINDDVAYSVILGINSPVESATQMFDLVKWPVKQILTILVLLLKPIFSWDAIRLVSKTH